MKSTLEAVEELGFQKHKKESLEKSYQEALKKETFQNLVNKVKLPKEVLMKHTSTLEKSAEEYKDCLGCKSILTCPHEMQGYCYLPKITNGNLTFSYTPCKHQKRLLEKNRYLENIYLFDIPKEIKEASIHNINVKDANRFDAIEWIHKFMNNYEENKRQKGLYLYGNFGCGKTYLIAAMFNELAIRGVRSAIIYWPEYLRDLKTSFDLDFGEKFEKVKKAPLLLIDDIGAEVTSSWSRDEILGPILQYRMQESLPTFFTSNLDLKALESHLSTSKDGVENIKARRIIERIEQLTDYKTMISKNLRK